MIRLAKPIQPKKELGFILFFICVQVACASKEKVSSPVEVVDRETAPALTQDKEAVDKIAPTSEPISKPIIRKVPPKSPKVKPSQASKVAEASEATEVAESTEKDETSIVRRPSGAAALDTKPDNSRMNRLYDGDPRLSAEQQGNSKQDIEITRSIRRKITKEKGLSIYAKNVKIITRERKVVLIGPVRSEGERQFVEHVAIEIAGIENVTSGLAIVER